MSEPVRVVRLAGVSPLRSQAAYHALGHAPRAAGAPDTILLIVPASPYVCIGYHQELEREVDTAACRRLGLPVIRRGVGGGAVLLDDGQVFANWVFAANHLPGSIESRFRLYAAALVETYRGLGVPAEHRPVNDIHVAGRKIGGTGAARMGEREVVVGSLMFDFDHDRMAQVLRVSSEKMRDKVARALHDYVTTLRRELGVAPDRDAVLAAYLEQCAAALGRPMRAGELTAEELRAVRGWERRLASAQWTQRAARRAVSGVRICADVSVHESEHKAAGGLVRATTTVRAGVVEDVLISGDFTVEPAEAVAALEQSLRGRRAAAEELAEPVAAWLAAVEAPGLSASDLLAALSLPQDGSGR